MTYVFTSVVCIYIIANTTDTDYLEFFTREREHGRGRARERAKRRALARGDSEGKGHLLADYQNKLEPRRIKNQTAPDVQGRREGLPWYF